MAKRFVALGEPKTCTGCGETFPNTLEYFYRTKKGQDIRLKAKCITCDKAQHADWRKRNPEKSRERGRRFHQRDIEKKRKQVMVRVNRHYEKHPRRVVHNASSDDSMSVKP
jgi:hypothetical protein